MELTTSEYCHKLLFNYIRLKGYSLVNTFPVYRANLNVILNRFPEPKKATILELQDFASEFKNNNTRRNICIMIRWLFGTVYSTPIDWQLLPYPKKVIKIQPIYTQEEINKVINAITNEKQKAIIALIADQGLRISEPCSILLSDVYFNQKIIIRSAKGDKDRLIFPSESAWKLINNYLDIWDNKPIKYLFEGQKRGNPYTPESIREIVIRYCNKTGIAYKGVHAIRRMTGTWSVENGIPETVTARKLGNTVKTLHKHYLIHSESYLKNIPTPLNA